MGTDDATTTVTEAPPGAPADWDTPIWDGEFADRWARIVAGDDGDAAGGDDPAPRPKPRPVKKKK